ncbi:unnamed protein product, partial [Prorocentrum cordatum]
MQAPTSDQAALGWGPIVPVPQWPPPMAPSPTAAGPSAPPKARPATARRRTVVVPARPLLPEAVDISQLPTEWVCQDVEELCRVYGFLKQVTCSGPGRFRVAFQLAESATKAAQALNNLKVPYKDGR